MIIEGTHTGFARTSACYQNCLYPSLNSARLRRIYADLRLRVDLLLRQYINCGNEKSGRKHINYFFKMCGNNYFFVYITLQNVDFEGKNQIYFLVKRYCKTKIVTECGFTCFLSDYLCMLQLESKQKFQTHDVTHDVVDSATYSSGYSRILLFCRFLFVS